MKKGGIPVTIGEKIKARRKELKMTTEELGRLIGVQRSAITKYEKKRDDLIKELNDYTGDKNTEYYKLLKKRVEDGIRFVDNCKLRIASVYKYKLIAEVGCYGSKEVYEDIISKKYNSAADFGGNKGLFNVEDGTKLLQTFATRPEFTVHKHNDKLKLLEYTLPVIPK